MGSAALTSQFRYLVIGITALLLAVYAVFYRQYDTITTLHASYATFIIMLGALPGVVALRNKREAGLIPLMPLHGIFYAITFGLPVLSNKTVWRAGGEVDITEALVLTIYGLLCLYLGFYGLRKFFDGMKPVQSRNSPIHLQIRLAWILFGFYLLLQFFPVLRSLPSVKSLSTPLGYFSLGVLAFLAFGGQLSRGHFVMFIIAALYTLVIKITSGSLMPAVLLIIFFGVLYWNKKRRIPWRLILIVPLIVIILNPIKEQFRDVTWYSGTSSQSLYDKIFLLAGVTQKYYSGSDFISKVSEDRSTINRLATISTFGYVIKFTPDYVPYWSGDSYHTLWTSFIPRAIWPDKPKSTIGQDFGHRYALIGTHNVRTSFNLPWLIEFYANFGTLGVLVGMFLVGLFFRFLIQKLSAPVSATLEHVLAVTVLFTLFYAESNFALMVGGILPVYIVFSVLLRLLSNRRSHITQTYTRHVP